MSKIEHIQAPTDRTYSKAQYTRAVIEAAEAAGVRLSALTVLYYLCKWSKGDGPTVDQSKWQIAAACGLTEKTVKGVLANLRALGVLRPIARMTGGRLRGGHGRGASVVYRLEIVQRGEKISPVSAGDVAAIGGKKFPEKGGKNFPNRGEKITPPNNDPMKNNKGKGGASRAGRSDGALDGGASPAPRPDTPEAAELRRFSADCAKHGYAEARRLQDLRRAAG